MLAPKDPFFTEIIWDDKGEPISKLFNDIYFTRGQGADESDYVFLKNNQLPNDWMHLKSGEAYTIAETGFGTGLNFLVAWQKWLNHAPQETYLHFISVEKFPLKPEDLKKALSLWPELSQLTDRLLAQYPPVAARGFHRLMFDQVYLTLIFEDALKGFNDLLPLLKSGPAMLQAGADWSPYKSSKGLVDAWFLDGFAPAKNPDLWSSELFNCLARLSKPGARFATFTAAGLVKNGLKSQGFEVFKGPGFGCKRDMLYGYFVQKPPPEHNYFGRHQDNSWHLNEIGVPLGPEVTVIGGGLAGCHLARALAQKGLLVKLLDGQGLASGTSGNPLGIVYARFSQHASALAEFNLLAYLFACRFYHSNNMFNTLGKACGVLQLPDQQDDEASLFELAQYFAESPEFLYGLNIEEASHIANIKLATGALFLKQSGYLSPVELCHTLCDHPNIQVINAQVADLHYENDQWHLLNASKAEIFQSKIVVVANGQGALDYALLSHLPLKSIRGQISYVEATTESQPLTSVLTGQGYIAPAINQRHCVGASYNLKSVNTALDSHDHEHNLKNVTAFSDDFSLMRTPTLDQGRVGFRCTPPDYLPLVGPVAKPDAMVERFAKMREDARCGVDLPGIYWPGLYVCLGLGSRGLTYAPICADILASYLTGQCPPLPRSQLLALHPERFLMRDISRRKR